MTEMAYAREDDFLFAPLINIFGPADLCRRSNQKTGTIMIQETPLDENRKQNVVYHC